MFRALPFPFFTFGHFGTDFEGGRFWVIHLRTLLDSTYKVDKHIEIMKYLILPLIAILLATTGGTALADNNSNSNSVTSTSTQSTNINGQGSETTTTSHNGGPPHVVTHTFHPHTHVIIVHENSPSHTIIIHKSSGSSTSNQNIPIVFVKGAGFVAPINCKLTSAGDKIVCDFEQVQIN